MKVAKETLSQEKIRPSEISKIFRAMGPLIGPCPVDENKRLEWCIKIIALAHGQGLESFNSNDWKAVVRVINGSPQCIDEIEIPSANDFAYCFEPPLVHLTSAFFAHSLKAQANF